MPMMSFYLIIIMKWAISHKKYGPCGLFQWPGLAYFSVLPVSVKRSRDLEWGLKFHE